MHIPVLVREVVGHLVLRPGGILVDATLGAGGHTRALLESAGPDAQVIGIDRDAEALDRARANLGPLAARVRFIHGAMADMTALVQNVGFQEVDAVLCDLGFSSDQLDDPARGFSFNADGPLDMRLDRTQARTAADVVNGTPERDLADLIFQFGGEPASRRIAAAIVDGRRVAPFRTTARLADVVARAAGGRRGRIHPATRTFQAIRMAVNGELEQAGAGCEAAIRLVRAGGRVAFITFHSGEDRVVKQVMAHHVGREVSLQQGGVRWEGEEPRTAWVVRKPLVAAADEVRLNPRARSAKLRLVERCAR